MSRKPGDKNKFQKNSDYTAGEIAKVIRKTVGDENLKAAGITPEQFNHRNVDNWIDKHIDEYPHGVKTTKTGKQTSTRTFKGDIAYKIHDDYIGYLNSKIAKKSPKQMTFIDDIEGPSNPNEGKDRKWCVAFSNDKHSDFISSLEGIKEDEGLKTNNEVIRFLLDFYVGSIKADGPVQTVIPERIEVIESRLQKQIDDIKRELLILSRLFNNAAESLRDNIERVMQ